MSSVLKKIIGIVVVFFILLFLLSGLYNNWSEVRGNSYTVNYFWLFISFGILLLSIVSLAYLWWKILKKIEPGKKMRFGDAVELYIYAEFGKYLPGKVWSILGRVVLGTKYGYAKRNLAISSYLDSVLAIIGMVTSGSILCVMFLGSEFSSLYYVLIFFILIAGLLFVQPKIFYPVFNYVLSKNGKEKIIKEEYLSIGFVFKMYLLYCLMGLVYGFSFLVLSYSFSFHVINNWALVMGSFPLATGLGVVALFAPSGLGVREGVLSLLAGSFVGVGFTIYISFIARIWFTLCEIFLLIIVLVRKKIKNG